MICLSRAETCATAHTHTHTRNYTCARCVAAMRARAQFAKPVSEESLAAQIVELLKAVYVGSARWTSRAGYELNVRLAREVVRREPADYNAPAIESSTSGQFIS